MYYKESSKFPSLLLLCSVLFTFKVIHPYGKVGVGDFSMHMCQGQPLMEHAAPSGLLMQVPSRPLLLLLLQGLEALMEAVGCTQNLPIPA